MGDFILSRHILIVFVVVLLCQVSCSVSTFSVPRPIERLVLVDSLAVAQHFDKVSYSHTDRTFFCMSRDENSISIYRNGVLFNRIGGHGFGVDSFRHLGDMTLGFDGFLYVLDSFERVVSRFDRDGRLQNKIVFQHIASPIRFTMSSFGVMFVYDSHAREIHSLESFDLSTRFTFGKFQFQQVETMFTMGDFVNIYDPENSQTSIYRTNGRHENSLSGFTFFDSFRNVLSFSQDTLVDVTQDKVLYQNNVATGLTIERGFYVLYDDTMVRVFRAEHREYVP